MQLTHFRVNFFLLVLISIFLLDSLLKSMSSNPILQSIDAEINHFNNAFPDVFNNDNLNQYFTVETFNNQFNHLSKTDLSILHLNIRSLAANGDDFISYIETLNVKFDIICLSETWLNDSNIIDNHFFPLYNSYHSFRPAGKRGGDVSIFVIKNHPFENLPHLSSN